jgi:hypothetical protein
MSTLRLHSKIDKIANILESKGKLPKINRTQLLANLYYLNKLIYQLYLIYTSDSHHKIKVLRLANLKDPQGNKILSKEEAKIVLTYYGPKIAELYNKIYQFQKISLEKKKNKDQKGGKPILDHPKYARNIEKLQLAETKMVEWLDHFHQSYEKLIDRIPFRSLKNGIKNNSVAMESIFNWIFFPLWSLENLPVMGTFVESQLDIIGVVIDNSDLFFEFAAPFIPLLMDIGLDVAQAVPGYGTAVTAVALPLNFAEGPIEYLIENGSDVLGLYINISRKQWGLAYISALEVIPNMTSFMDAFITNLVTANKWLNKINTGSERLISNIELISKTITVISDSSDTYITMMDNIKDDPYKLTQPDFVLEDIALPILDDVLIPNKHKLDFLKDIPLREISQQIHQNLPKIKKIMNNFDKYSENIELLYNDLVVPHKNKIPILDKMSDDKIKALLRDMVPIIKKIKSDPAYYILNPFQLSNDILGPIQQNIPGMENISNNKLQTELIGKVNPLLKQLNTFSKSITTKIDQ